MAASNKKGRILEDVVARLHNVNGLRAVPRQKFPSLRTPERVREIDVLIEASIGPYPFRIPVECKNWGNPVGVEDIDAYEGKLNDIGMIVRGAIYVAASGYESGAFSKGSDLGMVLLTIDGLTPDRLAEQLHHAVAGTLFLLPYIGEITFESPHSGFPVLVNPEGEFGGSIFDLAWKAWMDDPSLLLEERQGSIPVPEGWGSVGDGGFAQIPEVRFRLKKKGHLLKRSGSVAAAFLRDPHGQPTLGHVQASFESPMGKFNLSYVTTEAELSQELEQERPVLSALVRVKTPRVVIGGKYGNLAWPPDDKIAIQLWNSYQADPKAYEEGRAEVRIGVPSEITELFEPASRTYIEGLRSRLGQTWHEALWTHVT